MTTTPRPSTNRAAAYAETAATFDLDRPAWMAHGACRGLSVDLFFGDVAGSGINSAQALDVCMVCPVISECARYVLAAHIPHGVWGGMTARDRRNIARSSQFVRVIFHGTEAGYRNHRRAGEEPCDACREAFDAATRRRTPTPVLAPARQITNHGTNGGYQAHMKNGESPCGICSDAHARYNRGYRAAHS